MIMRVHMRTILVEPALSGSSSSERRSRRSMCVSYGARWRARGDLFPVSTCDPGSRFACARGFGCMLVLLPSALRRDSRSRESRRVSCLPAFSFRCHLCWRLVTLLCSLVLVSASVTELHCTRALSDYFSTETGQKEDVAQCEAEWRMAPTRRSTLNTSFLQDELYSYIVQKIAI